MPTYDYQCDKCKKTFEYFQSMKDDAVATCPKEVCQKKPWGRGKVKRLLGTGAGIIFKGSGFYQTDYRSSGYKEAAKKETAPAASTSGSEKPASAPSAPSAPSTAATPTPSKNAKP